MVQPQILRKIFFDEKGERKMIKNILQALVFGLAAVLLGVQTDVTVSVVLMVVGTIAAAFESSRFLSATEVGISTIAIIFAMKGWWLASLIVLAVLVIENLAFIFAPLRLRLMQLDRQIGQAGEG
jgi:hypothetical protein